MKTTFAIYKGHPVLNGDKITDNENITFTFISANESDKTVTVRCGNVSSGSYHKRDAGDFGITFEVEEE